MQKSLFQEEICSTAIAIDGFVQIRSYITKIQEEQLIDSIDKQLWLHDLKRRVQHYGYKYDYKARIITPDLKIGPLPDWVDAVGTKLFTDGFITQKPDQVIVNEYLPGQGISPHIDCTPCFSGQIASLSLMGACVMDFSHLKTKQKISFLLQPQDLLILSGSARYEWQHGIAARKTDKYNGQMMNRKRRVSLTFRKVMLAGL
jgi:alkylated DNA repair dioxygenase AlkB